MTIALAECDVCGARMPLREAFEPEALAAAALGVEHYVALEGPCTCGGTLREDTATTLAAILAFIREEAECPSRARSAWSWLKNAVCLWRR